MDAMTLKFECLRLASQGSMGMDEAEEIVMRAQKYYAFAIGQTAKPTTRKAKAKK